MSNKLAVYSPEDVVFIIAGIEISGFSPETFISIDKSLPTFSSRESSDGVVSRSHTFSKSYSVSLTLAGTSESNQVLSYLSRVDEITLLGKFPLVIKDCSGQSVFFSTESWIEQLPSVSFSTNVTDRNWTIFCSNASLNVGGNYESSPTPEDLLNIGVGFIGGNL